MQQALKAVFASAVEQICPIKAITSIAKPEVLWFRALTQHTQQQPLPAEKQP